MFRLILLFGLAPVLIGPLVAKVEVRLSVLFAEYLSKVDVDTRTPLKSSAPGRRSSPDPSQQFQVGAASSPQQIVGCYWKIRQ